jgi:RNA polymerase sigma-70 factor (ECF subfamily)
VSDPAGTAPSPADETLLVESLRAGDAGAFETLVRAHARRLFLVARRILGNDEDASDAVQEAFLSAFRAIGSFHGEARLSTWLHRIAVNAALMKLRTRKRAGEESLDDLLPAFDETGHHAGPQPAAWIAQPDAVDTGDTRRLVREAIDRLPETYRTVLLMRDIEDLDTGETAQALGITPNAVKIRLHRARQALRTLLDPHFRPVSRETGSPR